jgi:xanthine dehydrogenase molybdopterin binding subunit/xanthine dehydrogenase small subunit
MTSALSVIVNGERRSLAGVGTTTTLLDWLRTAGLTGTKMGCNEGDCGACTVALVDEDPRTGARVFRALNSCITLALAMAGRELLTVEGLAARGAHDAAHLHPVQDALVRHHGSQCGFCTPGVAVSMFEGFHREACSSPAATSDQLAGNLCRCTGYRPIRDAMADATAQRHKPWTPTGEDPHAATLRAAPTPLGAFDETREGQRFARPSSLAALLALLAAHPDAVLIAGATEIGVWLNKRGDRFPLLIATEGVRELRTIALRRDALVVGGAATLTELEESLNGEFPSLGAMLSVFAARQIRNRATLAGNLVTASPIGDMAPVLLSLDARLVLASSAGERTLPLDEFFLSYRKTALRPGEVVRAIEVPRPGAATDGLSRLTRSFKVSKRRELDISIVSAAFCVGLDPSGLVRHARLAYGGVSATPARARKAEAALLGRAWGQDAVDAAREVLAAEFTPLDDVRGGKEYRRGLVGSLFEKFALGITSSAHDEPIDYTVPGAFDAGSAPAASSRTLAHDSAIGHVTGASQYVDDAKLHGSALTLWPVSAGVAHARVLRVDTTAARAMPGIVAVLTAADIPGKNDVGAIREDEPLLAEREALFHGHMVAVVVGEDVAACRAAARAVVVELEPLPALLTIDDAIAAQSFHSEPHTIRRGDLDAALAAAPRRLSGRSIIGGQEHFYLETHAAYAERGDDDDVRVVSSTQHPSEIQAVVAHVLHVPRNQVVVSAPRMGGGFGGKETQGNTWAALVALAAWKTRRPVRVMLDRDVDMALTGKRHPFQAEWEAGFDDEGHLLALRAQLVSNGGWALDLSQSILDRALFHIDNAYFVPALEVTGRIAKTNVASNTAFRGFGGPQGMLVVEDVLDHVARTLALLPEDVRERNLYRGEGESRTTHYGQALEDDRIDTLWRSLRRDARLDERRLALAKWNAESPWVKRGLAMTLIKFGISFTASFLNQAGALVLVYRDGTVQVNHGGTEMGQGLHTKMVGVAMRELGLRRDCVRVMTTATDKVPNTSPTAASSGADLNGAAVRDACEQLRARLLPVAARTIARVHGVAAPDERSLVFAEGAVAPRALPALAVPFETVVSDAYVAQVQLSATGYYRTPGLHYDAAKGRGKPFHYFSLGAALAEVEIDGLSGMKRVVAVDVLQDVGDSLHPSIDRGQIEGAFVQGLGWLTGEELLWSPAGQLLSHSASTYQIPTFGDAPARFDVRLFPRATQASVVHGSKAVGEPPLMLALSVREALRDAIAAFGPAGGCVTLPSPLTHEVIWHAVRARVEARSPTPAC